MQQWAQSYIIARNCLFVAECNAALNLELRVKMVLLVQFHGKPSPACNFNDKLRDVPPSAQE